MALEGVYGPRTMLGFCYDMVQLWPQSYDAFGPSGRCWQNLWLELHELKGRAMLKEAVVDYGRHGLVGEFQGP